MAEKQTTYGKNLESYIQDMLSRAQTGASAAQAAGYPAVSDFTKAYYAGIPSLYMYGSPEQMQALQRAGDLYGAYGEAGGYNKTPFADIGAAYRAAGIYDPAQFTMADYTTENIQKRMSPYEELVASRGKERLKRAYDEARGEREAQAVRAGAYGGSGQAIQEEIARRQYLEQLADMDAASLQAAFESGAGLYSKEIADRLAAQGAAESSRQFGKETEMSGIAGALNARQQEAAQEAAAKEAQFAGLQGQQEAARQQALMAQQRQEMQVTNLAASQAAGQQQEERALAQAQYPLGIAALQGNVVGSLTGGASQVPQSTQKTSTMQNILGGISTAAGVVDALGGLKGVFGAAGGLVPDGLQRVYNRYQGGGLATLEPQYYSYER